MRQGSICLAFLKEIPTVFLGFCSVILAIFTLSKTRFDHQLNLLFHQLQLQPLRQTPTITAIDANVFLDYLKDTMQFYTDIRHITDVSSLFVLRAFPYDVSEYEKTKVIAVDDDFQLNGKPRVIVGGNNDRIFPYIRAFNMKKGRYQDGYYFVQISAHSPTGSEILFDPKFVNTVVSGCLLIQVLQSSETDKAESEWFRRVIIPQILHIRRLAYVIVRLDERFGYSAIYDEIRNNDIKFK